MEKNKKWMRPTAFATQEAEEQVNRNSAGASPNWIKVKGQVANDNQMWVIMKSLPSTMRCAPLLLHDSFNPIGHSTL